MVRFNPKTEVFTEYLMPTRVTYTREIEFDADGNIWTSNSNGPTRHIENHFGSLIKLALK
jgi:streptogramin lyase